LDEVYLVLVEKRTAGDRLKCQT